MKETLGLAAAAFVLASYLVYFVSIMRRKTRPHIFSQFIWGMEEGIVFAAQITSGGGPGAWMMGVASVLAFVIAVQSCFYGEKNITVSDWIAFLGACAAIALWLLTKTPFWSVLLVAAIDLFSYYPTFRKSVHRPWDESALSYFLMAVACLFSLFALESFSLITSLSPLLVILSNSALIALLLIRRRQLHCAGPIG